MFSLHTFTLSLILHRIFQQVLSHTLKRMWQTLFQPSAMGSIRWAFVMSIASECKGSLTREWASEYFDTQIVYVFESAIMNLVDSSTQASRAVIKQQRRLHSWPKVEFEIQNLLSTWLQMTDFWWYHGSYRRPVFDVITHVKITRLFAWA